MVKTSGLEPPTPCMSSRYSNQLSYAFIESTVIRRFIKFGWDGWIRTSE